MVTYLPFQLSYFIGGLAVVMQFVQICIVIRGQRGESIGGESSCTI